MDLIFTLLIIFDLTVLSFNQASIQFSKSETDGNTGNRVQKTDRVLRPIDDNNVPPMNPGQQMMQNMPMMQGNYDPIESSYQRQQQFPPIDPNYQISGPGEAMGSRIQPGGNFPGDLPVPGIPAQPGMTNIDRHMPGMLGDNCYHKLRYYMASCEDALLQRQRDTRNARTAPDIQRRLCCSLYFYHDCLSKVVVQHCRDASPMVVNLVMPENRRREMVINCRTQTRDQCNGSSHFKVNLFVLVPLIAALIVLI